MKKSEQQFDERWDLPEKFRITAELTPKMRKILEESDAQQKELLSAFGGISQQTPQTRERARAAMICEKYESMMTNDLFKVLPNAQKSEWANAYAILGRYDQATNISPTGDERAEYHDIWEAVWRDETETCEHPEHHHYAEKDVFSVKLNADCVLMKCNICRFRNVLPPPEFLTAARAKRAEHRNRFTGENPHNLIRK